MKLKKIVSAMLAGAILASTALIGGASLVPAKFAVIVDAAQA